MAEQHGRGKSATKKPPTGSRVQAKVGKDERRQVVSRATSRVKTSRPVNTRKVLRD